MTRAYVLRGGDAVRINTDDGDMIVVRLADGSWKLCQASKKRRAKKEKVTS